MPEADTPIVYFGPGATEISAATAALRRVASTPRLAAGISASVRQRVLAIEPGEDGKERHLITPAAVFSEPHLALKASAVDHEAAVRLGAEARTSQAVKLLSSVSNAATALASPDTGLSEAELTAMLQDLDLSLLQTSTSSDPIVQRFKALASGILGSNEPGPSALGLTGDPVDAVSAQDFSQYVFAREPTKLLDVSTPPNVTLPQDFDEYIARIQEIITNAVNGHCWQEQELGAGYFSISFTQYFPGFIQTIFRLFCSTAAADVYAFYRSLVPGYAGSTGSALDDILGIVNWWLVRLCASSPYNRNDLASSFDAPALWTNAASEIIAEFKNQFADARTSNQISGSVAAYPFQPYPTGSVNFGLRLVYRQYWRFAGNQIGEIVRTIPLGPRQSEKVSIKTIVSAKQQRTSETAKTIESSEDSATTSKDSSEVVKEASDKFKWNVEAEAGVNYGAFSGKLSAGMGGDIASNSKDTKSNINETMSKTASRMKLDTKVVVTTEDTRTDETSRTSEISNPNDEIAVTYVYSKLMRQYELYTELAEVNSVVFVPEPLPGPAQIDAGFVRTHAAAILKALLDPMYADDVRQMVSEPDEIDLSAINTARAADVFKDIAGAAKTALAALPGFGGQYMPDFLSPVLDAQMRDVGNARAMEMDRQRRAWRRASLFDHLRLNILHYMRAIWASEDRDQRWLRYSRIQVPTIWVHDGAGGTGGSPPRRDGNFRPDYSVGSMAPLTEVINPAGPIGYVGNYAVFLMKGSPRLANMNRALAMLRSPYVEFVADVGAPAGMLIRDAIVYDPVANPVTYVLTRTATGWTGVMQVDGGSDPITVVASGRTIDIDDSLRLVWDGTAPAAGATLTITARANGALQDPELLLHRMTSPLPPEASEAAFFSAALLTQMAQMLPDVSVALARQRNWTELSAEAKALVRRRYHVFLMVRQNSTRLVLDTNNLVLDLEVGRTPSLEAFKRMHRYIDVLKELENRLNLRLENIRKFERLKAGNLADPDIERVSVFGSQGELRDVVDAVIADADPNG